MKKWVVAVVLAAVAGGGLSYWLGVRKAEGSTAGGLSGQAAPAAGQRAGGPGGGGPRRGAAVAVEVVASSRVTLRDLGIFAGSLLPRSRVVVSARVAGRLERVLADVGDRVESGRLLAVLDDDEYQQQVEQSRAELQVARAGLETARISLETAGRDLERVQALREKKIASESELDQADAQKRKAEAQHTVAQAQVRQREAALRAAELRLSQTEIRSDWQDGSAARVVGERFAEPGALLRANDPILSLLDIGTLVAVIQVTERSYARLQPGLRAEVSTDVLPGRTFAGVVSRVAPFLHETTRQAEVKVEVPNGDAALKPGMPVRVVLEFGRKDDVPAVPVAAVTTRDGVQGVFVVDEAAKTARFVAISTGVAEGPLVEVLDRSFQGLVVTLGQHLLEDGAAVTVSRGSSASLGNGAQNSSSPRRRS